MATSIFVGARLVCISISYARVHLKQLQVRVLLKSLSRFSEELKSSLPRPICTSWLQRLQDYTTPTPTFNNKVLCLLEHISSSDFSDDYVVVVGAHILCQVGMLKKVFSVRRPWRGLLNLVDWWLSDLFDLEWWSGGWHSQLQQKFHHERCWVFQPSSVFVDYQSTLLVLSVYSRTGGNLLILLPLYISWTGK